MRKDWRNKEGNTPLHLAVAQDNVLLVEALNPSRAELKKEDKAEKTPLSLSASPNVVEAKGLEESCNVALKQILADARYADKIASKVEGIGEINPEADHSLIVNRASKLLLAKLTKPVELMGYLCRSSINEALQKQLMSKYEAVHADFFAHTVGVAGVASACLITEAAEGRGEGEKALVFSAPAVGGAGAASCELPVEDAAASGHDLSLSGAAEHHENL